MDFPLGYGNLARRFFISEIEPARPHPFLFDERHFQLRRAAFTIMGAGYLVVVLK